MNAAVEAAWAEDEAFKRDIRAKGEETLAWMACGSRSPPTCCLPPLQYRRRLSVRRFPPCRCAVRTVGSSSNVSRETFDNRRGLLTAAALPLGEGRLMQAEEGEGAPTPAAPGCLCGSCTPRSAGRGRLGGTPAGGRRLCGAPRATSRRPSTAEGRRGLRPRLPARCSR